jgi:hypothetical protein
MQTLQTYAQAAVSRFSALSTYDRIRWGLVVILIPWTVVYRTYHGYLEASGKGLAPPHSAIIAIVEGTLVAGILYLLTYAWPVTVPLFYICYVHYM